VPVKTQIKIAHSPDSDDAFMFYAIKNQKIDLKQYQFSIESAEIDVLNQLAVENEKAYDIFAVSFHAYHYLKDKFEILRSGSSMAGSDYGPRLVCKAETLAALQSAQKKLSDLKIAIPGKLTSAYLALQIYAEKQNTNIKNPVFCSYNDVFSLLENNSVDASLLIHEAQLRFQDLGYQLIIDLGSWWHQTTNGLNLPLGCNVIRKALGQETISDINAILKSSIEWGLAHLDETLIYARDFAQNNLDDTKSKKYIDMYVNSSTVELSDDDYRSIDLLLSYLRN